MRTVRIPTLLMASVLFTACASAPGGERPAFGESVRHMIDAQTYTPGDQSAPLQGTRAAAAMEAYGQDTSDPREFGKGRMEID